MASKGLFGQKVHVAFLGWEIDRIVQPILGMNGDRLIIICFPKEREGAWAYLEKIKTQLEASNVQVDVIETSLHDLVDLLAVLNKVFQVERAKENQIFVNVSAGTKISACASTIASMSRDDVTAYYVRTEKYHPREKNWQPPLTLTSGVKDIYQLPECKINVPDSKYIKTLRVINMLSDKEIEKDLPPRVYVKDLIDALKAEGLLAVKENRDNRKQASSEYMAVNALLKPLISWKYLTVAPKRRNKFVEITKDGKNAIYMYLQFDLASVVKEVEKPASINGWITILEGVDGSSTRHEGELQ